MGARLALSGMFARLGDDLDTAEARFDEARALAHRAGNLEREATALLNLGDLAYRRERYDCRPAPAAGAALDLFRDQGLPDAAAIAAGNLAQVESSAGGQHAAAVADARQALAARSRRRGHAAVLFGPAGLRPGQSADRPRAAALLRLVIHHPAAEYQDLREVAQLLAHLGVSAVVETPLNSGRGHRRRPRRGRRRRLEQVARRANPPQLVRQAQFEQL